MPMQKILEAYKKLNPDIDNQREFINPKLAADMLTATEGGDTNAVFYTADYVSDEIKSELAKHPNIHEYEAAGSTTKRNS